MHRQRGQPLHRRCRRHHDHLLAFAEQPGPFHHGGGGGVVGQHQHVRGSGRAECLAQLVGRQLRADDQHIRPLGGEQLAQRATWNAGEHGDVPREGGLLIGEPGDLDLVHPPGLDARFDRRPDVVAVHVHRPGSGAVTDHGHAVAEPAQRIAQGERTILIGVGQQVHDLVLVL